MPTPPGFAACSYEFKHSSVSRSAFVTFACDPTVTDPNTIAASLNGAYAGGTSMKACIDANVTMVGTRVSLGTDGGEDLQGWASTAAVGGRAGTTVSPNCAVLVRKLTSRGGRRGRGRMYLPWAALTSNVDESGQIAAADKTLITDSITTWMSAVVASVGPLVLLHRPSAPGVAHPSTPGAPNVVTGHSVDGLIATQRRRLGR